MHDRSIVADHQVWPQHDLAGKALTVVSADLVCIASADWTFACCCLYTSFDTP